MTIKIRELNKKLRNNSNTAFKNLADASFSERRSDLKDRRKMNTYIWNDQRSGIADRRRNVKGKTLMKLSENDLK